MALLPVAGPDGQAADPAAGLAAVGDAAHVGPPLPGDYMPMLAEDRNVVAMVGQPPADIGSPPRRELVEWEPSGGLFRVATWAAKRRGPARRVY